ncbi:MAG: DinB family protein [Planctomycetota bacterium]
MPLKQETKVYQFLLGYGEMLLDDIAPEDAYKLICDGGVSPAWIMGHLGFVANRIIAMGGGEPKIDFDVWQPHFGGNSKPTGEQGDMPSWDEILGVWRTGHADLAALMPSVSPELLASENPNERIRPGLPTVEDFLGFVLTGHEGMHLGQLSTWRRVQGRPPLF